MDHMITDSIKSGNKGIMDNILCPSVHYYGHIAKNEQLIDQWIGYKYAKEDLPSTNHQHWILGKNFKRCNPHLCFATNIEAKQNKRKNQEQEQGMGQVNGI